MDHYGRWSIANETIHVGDVGDDNGTRTLKIRQNKLMMTMMIVPK